MRLFHITLWSLEKQKVLIPHIPQTTSIGEEVETERISMAPTIEECIRGIGNVEIWDEENSIRVYTLDIDEKDDALIDWTILYAMGKVHDSPITHEYWYKKMIIPIDYAEYKVYDIETKKYMIVRDSERSKIIDVLKGKGLFLAQDMLKKNTIEIVNEYFNQVVIEDIKNVLTHEYEYENMDLFRQIFGEDPPIEKKYDFHEAEYVEKCRLVRI